MGINKQLNVLNQKWVGVYNNQGSMIFFLFLPDCQIWRCSFGWSPIIIHDKWVIVRFWTIKIRNALGPGRRRVFIGKAWQAFQHKATQCHISLKKFIFNPYLQSLKLILHSFLNTIWASSHQIKVFFYFSWEGKKVDFLPRVYKNAH